jgi:hypothetical protein
MKEADYVLVERLTILRWVRTALGDTLTHLEGAAKERLLLAVRAVDSQIADDFKFTTRNR